MHLKLAGIEMQLSWHCVMLCVSSTKEKQSVFSGLSLVRTEETAC